MANFQRRENLPFLLPIFALATYGARGVISVTDTATWTHQSGSDAPPGGQATDAASLSDSEQPLSNRERDGGPVASARDVAAVDPFVVSYKIIIILCPAGQAQEGVS